MYNYVAYNRFYKLRFLHLYNNNNLFYMSLHPIFFTHVVHSICNNLQILTRFSNISILYAKQRLLTLLPYTYHIHLYINLSFSAKFITAFSIT